MLHKKSNSKTIGIVICVYEPNFKLLSNLLSSIKKQTVRNWHCYIFDDSANSNDLSHLLDNRFTYFANTETLGTYKNFEQSVRYASTEHSWVFLSDQDDSWDSRKLEKYSSYFQDGSVEVIHADARVVDTQGNVLADSLHRYEKRKHSKHFLDLIIKNTITGTTMAVKSDYINRLPEFPRSLGWHHDLWISLQAAKNGTLLYLNESLTDYVQHSKNQIGAKARPRYRELIKFKTVMHSFLLRYQLLQNAIGNVELAESRWIAKQRTQIEFLKHVSCKGMDKYHLFEYILGSAYAFLFPILESYRKISTALKQQYSLGKSIFVMVRTKQFRSRFKKYIGSNTEHREFQTNSRYLDSSKTVLTFQSPKYILVIPNLTLPVFGGIATALRFAYELQQSGNRVQIATISESSNITKEELFQVAESLNFDKDSAEQLFGNFSNLKIEISEGDILIATAWWTELAARNAINYSGFKNCEIVYFVQDFECLFYPAGSEYAAALETYYDAELLVINSVPLANYLSENIVSEKSYRDRMEVFQPQYLFKFDSSSHEKTTNIKLGPIRILLYGRPNTPRNLFELAIKSLEEVTTLNDTKSFEILSVGEVHEDVTLRNGLKVKSLGPLSVRDYKSQIIKADIGLSLMLSPHPSYPPLEMAALGLETVSNDYLGYKGAYLKSLGIHVAEPTVKSIVAEIQQLIDVKFSEMKKPMNEKNLDRNKITSEVSTLSEIALTLSRNYPNLNQKNE